MIISHFTVTVPGVCEYDTNVLGKTLLRIRRPVGISAFRTPNLDIHYRGVQWEGGAVDWGSII